MLNNRLIIAEILIITSFLCLISCNKKEKPFQNKDWLSLAIKSEKYIQTAKDSYKEGIVWREMPDSINTKTEKDLYGGTSGVILFYLELFNTTKDSIYLDQARSGADYLVHTLKDTIYAPEEVGLYTGLAGIGFTLTEVFKSTGNEKYKRVALQTITLLEQSSNKSTNGVHWGGITDIVYGSAGIGLYLQYITNELGSKKADSLSRLVAEGLLDNAIETQGGLRWRSFPKDKFFMDNFSHGTSGIAYFLTEEYKRTKIEKYLDAAIKATKILDSLSNDKGYIPHHFPEGENLYYLSWCHGPAGTSRLYYSLFDVTQDEKWLDKIIHSADNLILEGIEQKETPGYWNNVGKCCGATGVAEYYFWLFEITGNEEYLDYSEKMTQKILSSSTHEKDYMKWIHAENRKSPDKLAAQTGLMQGSAGMGLWFLKLNAYQVQKKPQILLPDTPDSPSIE